MELVSMPMMMDTVLNLGLSDKVVKGISTRSGKRFAYDSYCQYICMFGDVASWKLKAKKEVHLDTELITEGLNHFLYKDVYGRAKATDFPTDPFEQLRLAILAVFDSWSSSQAVEYRKINQIIGLFGTAVNVQTTVFGSMGPTPGTGVLFTHNPSTGEKKLYGDYLINAQGEDVVASICTPQDIDTMKSGPPDA